MSQPSRRAGFRHPLSEARSFVRRVVAVEPWRALAAILLMASRGFITGVGLALLVSLLQVVGLDLGRGPLDQISRWLMVVFNATGIRLTLVSVLAAYVLVTTVSGWLTRVETSVSNALADNLVATCRQRLAEAIGRTTWVFFSRARSSDLTHVLIAESDRVGSVAQLLVNLVATSLVTAVYVGFAIRVSWSMTVLVLACGAGLMLLLKRYRQRATESGERASDVFRRLYSTISDYVNGMKTARSFGVDDRHLDTVSTLTREVRAVNRDAWQNRANVRFAFEIGTVLTLAVVVYFGFEVRHLRTAEVFLLLFLFARILPQIGTIEQTYQWLLEYLPAFSAVEHMEARCRQAAEPIATGGEPVELHQSVELHGVSFSYGSAPAVQDLDLPIRVGETTALVGPSGAGKSTVADLVIGLIRPATGAVLVDGAPLSPERIRAWREQIGYVAQDTFLFHDTVRANLLWARPSATVDELWGALRLAAAEEFVAQLPEGLETVLGDRGVLVSGGERQRLALARALLRKPALLILDEATSSLDSENERRIQQAIENLHGHMTIFVITHRLFSIRHADVIHVLERGRVVESGDWEKLLQRPRGLFRELYDAQVRVEPWHDADEMAQVLGR